MAGNPLDESNGEYTVTLAGSMEVIVNIKEVGAADPVVLYTVKTTTSTAKDKTANYISETTITDGGLTFTVTNFNTGDSNNTFSNIRAGRKNNASIAYITVGQITAKVSSITITVDSVTTGKINEIYLEVSDSADFTGAKKVALTGTLAKGDMTFNIAAGDQGEGKYYRLVFDCASGTSNGLIQISKVVLTGFPKEDE